MSDTVKTRKIHMTGVGGIGMSGLAQLLVRSGEHVRGTDPEESPVMEMLRTHNVDVQVGPQVAGNVADDTDILVYSDAVKEDNPERARASELGIPQFSYFEMLGHVSEQKRTVAVAGTNGKTTTTGMLARVLTDAGASPSVVVGSIVADFKTNYLYGESDLFVVEACEYRRHFLNLEPEVLIVTNLEFDHTDYFTDLADVQDAFRTLMEKVPAHGAIITDTENPNIQPILEGLVAPVIHYPSELAYPLTVPGEFNQMNARAAASAARFLVPDIDEEKLAHSLYAFKGAWRRFEYKGKTVHGTDVYDDYAHHPTAIQETLRALRARMDAAEGKGGKMIVAFHPHLYSRTRDLLDGFARAFGDADKVFIAPIYGAREIDDGSVSNELLAERIRAEGKDAEALGTLDEVKRLADLGRDGDVIMTMGAGDIYKIADELVI